MYIGVGSMGILLIALTYVLCRFCKQARFRFIISLIVLLMISDLALGTLAVCFYYEGIQMSQPKELTLAVTIGVCSLCYNFGTMSMMWLFSYKYWIIAREVPKLFFEAGRDITFNERSYRIFNITGLFINFIPACLTAYFRAKLSYQSNQK